MHGVLQVRFLIFLQTNPWRQVQGALQLGRCGTAVVLEADRGEGDGTRWRAGQLRVASGHHCRHVFCRSYGWTADEVFSRLNDEEFAQVG